MGLFIMGGNTLSENECLDVAEELVEKELVYSNVESTTERLKRWRDEFLYCAQHGSVLYGYLLSQYSSLKENSVRKRTGAYCSKVVGGIDLGTPEVLDAMIVLSRSIHRDEISTSGDWLFENLSATLKQTVLFELLDEAERKEVIGITKATVRHLHRYKDPVYFKSDEAPQVYFIQERADRKEPQTT